MIASDAPRYWFPKPYADRVAKLRVPFGFLLLVTFALLSKPTVESMFIGLPIAILGLLLRGWAAGCLAKNQALATGGPYAYIRNPLYVGTLLVAAGIIVAARDTWLALIFAAVFLLVYLPVVELEEQHLRQIFPNYHDYASKIARFIPRGRWTAGSDAKFTWSLYRKNEEYQALLGLLIAYVWLAAKYWWTAVR